MLYMVWIGTVVIREVACTNDERMIIGKVWWGRNQLKNELNRGKESVSDKRDVRRGANMLYAGLWGGGVVLDIEGVSKVKEKRVEGEWWGLGDVFRDCMGNTAVGKRGGERGGTAWRDDVIL